MAAAVGGLSIDFGASPWWITGFRLGLIAILGKLGSESLTWLRLARGNSEDLVSERCEYSSWRSVLVGWSARGFMFQHSCEEASYLKTGQRSTDDIAMAGS